MITSFQKKVYNIVRRIPKGRVATYTDIARAIGCPRAMRAVGNALNKNRYVDVPCHRVIRRDGSAGGFVWGRKKKIKLLCAEGVLLKI